MFVEAILYMNFEGELDNFIYVLMQALISLHRIMWTGTK